MTNLASICCVIRYVCVLSLAPNVATLSPPVNHHVSCLHVFSTLTDQKKRDKRNIDESIGKIDQPQLLIVPVVYGVPILYYWHLFENLM